MQLAESYLAKEPKGSSGADRYQVVVHVSAETLRAEAPGTDVSAETPQAENVASTRAAHSSRNDA